MTGRSEVSESPKPRVPAEAAKAIRLLKLSKPAGDQRRQEIREEIEGLADQLEERTVDPEFRELLTTNDPARFTR
jgi:hypothetical protein